jgi:hypothetical protein
MHWFRQFSGAGRSRVRKPQRRERARLGVEALEQRSVPTIIVKPHFGAETPHDDPEESLSSPALYLIYWGSSSYWTPNKMNQYTDAANKLVSGGFLSGVTQYGSDGNASVFYPTFADTMNPLPSQFDSDGDQLGAQLDLLNQQGALRATGRQTIYVFVTPDPNNGPQVPGAGGMNWGTSGNLLIWLGDTYNVDTFSHVLSHELVESMSSPDGDGFMVNPGANWPGQPGWPASMWSGWGQIGDYEPDQTYLFHMTNGVQVQAYWSQNDQAFIVPDGTALQQFVLTPNYANGQFSGYDLDVRGFLGAAQNDQFAISMTTNPIMGTNELAITANGETAWFDAGTIHNINIDGGSGQTTLTLNGLSGLQAGASVNVSSGGDLKVIYTGTSSVQQNIAVSANGKLTVVDAAFPHSLPVAVANNAITVEGNSPLQYASVPGITAVRALEVDGGSNLTFTIQSTASNIPLSLVTSDVNNNVVLQGVSGPLTISTILGDVITPSVQAGGQLTLDNTADPSNLDITITNNAVQFRNCVTISFQGMQGLTVKGGPGNDRYIVQTTAAATPLTLDPGTGTNEVDLAGAPRAIMINSRGTDTVNVGSAQSLDSIGPVTVHGDGNTVVAVNDQATSSSASTQYTLTNGSLTRVAAFPGTRSRPGIGVTTTINYDNVKALTLTAGNNGPNTVNVESASIPTTIYGGATTSQINLAPTSQNLDNLGTFLTISGGSETVYVYDQANPHGSSTYAVYDGVTRTATGSNPVGFTAFSIQGLTLYTGKAANQVAVSSLPVAMSSLPASTTINSGGPDAITVTAYAAPTTNVLVGRVTESSQLTINGNGGTLAVVQGGGSLQNDPFDTFGDNFTVTDQAVTRVGYWHKVIHQINDPEVPPNPHDPRPPNGATLDVVRTDTLNYNNLKSIFIQGGAINSTFDVQSTPVGTPVAIHGGLQVGFRGYPIPGAGNQFVVGLNGSVKNIRSQLTLIGGSPDARFATGPTDTLLVDDSQAATTDKVTVTGTQVGVPTDQFFGGGSVTYGNMSSLTLNLSKAADDSVQLTPSAATAFVINGDPAEFLAGHGAGLNVDRTGVVDALLTPGGAGAGTLTFTKGSRQPVTFKNMGAVHTH